MEIELVMPGSKQDIWTVKSILRTVTQFLEEKSCETPRLDSEVLLAHILGVDRVNLYTGYDRPLLPGELEKYRVLVKRRVAGEPAAYLVGHKEFYSLDFSVGPGVLVPRPETEFLVSAAIEEAKKKEGDVKAADIGTGSGCVAVALAVYSSNCEVIAVELSSAATEFARRNVVAHDTQGRVTVVEGMFLEPLHKMGLEEKLDMVLSNPPYIAEREYDGLPVTVREYEPRKALVAGKDGTECHRRIASEAPGFLVSGGLLALEAGAGQVDR
jgi:release factor glutamine methyltransferase